ncbi:5-oxoprolinase subunit PxpB [Porticoccaceae bacterium LTM1]|nr:5-oxoprolinase subunit PxpB [Porticoccaceae bacterium LTM1]
MSSEVSIVPASEEAIIIYLAEQADETVLEKIRVLGELIESRLSEFVVDLVPSFTSLTVYYDVSHIDYSQLRHSLQAIVSELLQGELPESESRYLELPVYYGEKVAEDMARVCELTGMTAEQVVELHSQCELRVYALGFRPGFGFMGSLPEALKVPRLDTPRKKVPKGAVAITETQTAVYPDVSPGGWNIIGRCPLEMFDRSGPEPAALLQVGDRVKFVPVDRDEFIRLGGQL